jgi:hypothetical protein
MNDDEAGDGSMVLPPWTEASAFRKEKQQHADE